ncbi:ferrous iron transporter B [Cellulomonas sp. CW35]|uniref:ferrous iron transporter B n=1 Tax=Cellulomonas sp. CW35 TaxID=3458249 RepID=UPI004034B2C9
MSCHDDDAAPAAATSVLDAPRVVLVGNPNVGKSTLFNALTGARQRVVNAPGTTVELQEGRWRVEDVDLRLVDLPGTYALQAASPDEQVVADELDGGAADLVVLVADASALARSLLLAGQVARSAGPDGRGVPVVVALTMGDVARARGLGRAADHLRARLGVPVVEVDPRTGAGAGELARVVTAAVRTRPTMTLAIPDDDAPDDALYDWVADVLAAVPAPVRPVRTWSDRIDRVLLDARLGVPVFLGVMWALFQLTTSVAAPLVDGVDRLVNGVVADAVRGVLPTGWLQGLVVDGVLAGAGTVLSFVPLMALMFVAVALLEDCGYLARAAFVADRAMRTLGLDGRAVLPLVVGFGCNLPALAATRTLPHARQRLLVGLLVPFTSCTARLTVYVLLASVFFPEHAGTAIFVMYVASVLLVVLGGTVLRRTLFRDLVRQPLVLVLPAYQRPGLRAIAVSSAVRARAFVRKAGSIIVVTLTAVWVLLAVPVAGGHDFAAVPVADSLYGRAAHTAAPVFGPTGFGSWEATAALATGFVAKEVVVGSFAQTAAVAEPDDPAQPGLVGERLRATFDASSGGHGAAAAAAFLWFVLAYSPCLATLAEQRRLLGSRWTAFGLVVGLVVAWVGAVLVFTVGKALG